MDFLVLKSWFNWWALHQNTFLASSDWGWAWSQDDLQGNISPSRVFGPGSGTCRCMMSTFHSHLALHPGVRMRALRRPLLGNTALHAVPDTHCPPPRSPSPHGHGTAGCDEPQLVTALQEPGCSPGHPSTRRPYSAVGSRQALIPFRPAAEL